MILSWSNVGEADNYTLNITPAPLQPSGDQSVFTVMTTSFSLTVPYNEQYNVTISASNCAGTSSPSTPLAIFVGKLESDFVRIAEVRQMTRFTKSFCQNNIIDSTGSPLIS